MRLRSPATATETLRPGGSTTVDPSPTLHLDTLPPKADIVLAFDTTGSMGGAITDAKNDATSMARSRPPFQSARFAVADFKDYPLVVNNDNGGVVAGYSGFPRYADFQFK